MTRTIPNLDPAAVEAALVDLINRPAKVADGRTLVLRTGERNGERIFWVETVTETVSQP